MNDSQTTEDLRWTTERAQAWYRGHPWLVGCNFLPSSAINQLEMFQPDDYDRNRDVLVRELDMAVSLGMNTLRVFLHDLLWSSHPAIFFQRLDDFLDLCEVRRIKPMLVFFDACHGPDPVSGLQPAPRPGIHNSGWVQSPAVSVLRDESEWLRLEHYLTDVLRRYREDDRILCWDLYNEPCNCAFDQGEAKQAASAKLVRHAFAWARKVNPQQPLTVGVWDWPLNPWIGVGTPLAEAQSSALDLSDVISFHCYGSPSDALLYIDELTRLGRPILCTEYLARTNGNRFQNILPLLCERNIAAYNWGLVSGKSQTIYPWKSPGGRPEPEEWFHDILRPDGTAHDHSEVDLIQKLALKNRPDFPMAFSMGNPRP